MKIVSETYIPSNKTPEGDNGKLGKLKVNTDEGKCIELSDVLDDDAYKAKEDSLLKRFFYINCESSSGKTYHVGLWSFLRACGSCKGNFATKLKNYAEVDTSKYAGPKEQYNKITSDFRNNMSPLTNFRCEIDFLKLTLTTNDPYIKKIVILYNKSNKSFTLMPTFEGKENDDICYRSIMAGPPWTKSIAGELPQKIPHPEDDFDLVKLIAYLNRQDLKYGDHDGIGSFLTQLVDKTKPSRPTILSRIRDIECEYEFDLTDHEIVDDREVMVDTSQCKEFMIGLTNNIKKLKDTKKLNFQLIDTKDENVTGIEFAYIRTGITIAHENQAGVEQEEILILRPTFKGQDKPGITYRLHLPFNTWQSKRKREDWKDIPNDNIDYKLFKTLDCLHKGGLDSFFMYANTSDSMYRLEAFKRYKITKLENNNTQSY